jgi:hypothetical protein
MTVFGHCIGLMCCSAPYGVYACRWQYCPRCARRCATPSDWVSGWTNTSGSGQVPFLEGHQPAPPATCGCLWLLKRVGMLEAQQQMLGSFNIKPMAQGTRDPSPTLHGIRLGAHFHGQLCKVCMCCNNLSCRSELNAHRPVTVSHVCCSMWRPQ